MAVPKFETFEAFWPYYLTEHRLPITRWFHWFGTSTAALGIVLSIVTLRPWLAPLAFVWGYVPAWVSHFFIEKNRPATFTYPLWSFRGDLRMCFLMWTGRLGPELQRAVGG